MNEPVREPIPLPAVPAESSLIGWTQVIYGLHAFSLLTGIIGAATVVGAFLTGWPSIIAVILNYAKRAGVRGTWLESHFRWQIRTFWFGLLWVSLCVLFVLVTLGIGLLIAWVPILLTRRWFIYRIVKVWANRRRHAAYRQFAHAARANGGNNIEVGGAVHTTNNHIAVADLSVRRSPHLDQLAVPRSVTVVPCDHFE